ncbi:MAG: family 16 glycoside hydrolase, partial [Blastocatellia bacterium]
MTWVNTGGDFYPGADRGWAFGSGAGGSYVLWNHRHGIVFAGFGVETGPTNNGIPHIIEAHLAAGTVTNPKMERNSNEWKIVPKGNGGVLYHVSEEPVTAWHYAPEVQILDNSAYPNRDKRQLAGAFYDLYAPLQRLANACDVSVA